MTNERNKAETKNSVLTENTAQAVFKYLDDQESNRTSMHTRWIWELLQNARDTSTTDSNSLIAEIRYNSKELIFLHNGRGFKEKEIAHLIYHGSTKFEEEETIGRYGSGFLTTHLLSSEIGISGQLDDGRWFDFRLDRKPETVDALRNSMDEAWDNFNPSIEGLQEPLPTPFSTRFIYPIVGNNAPDAVENGIETLKQCAPYVVVFNQVFSQINIKTPCETLSFKVVERRNTDVAGMQEITVSEHRNEDIIEMKYLLAQGKKTLVTAPLKSNGVGFVCQEVVDVPRLFLGFPLVGTEHFSFPAVINSFTFAPTETRDGVYLGQSDDQKNRNNETIIEEACGLLVQLLKFAASKKWNHVHQWVKVSPIETQKWLNSDWLRIRIKENFIEEILKYPIVLNQDENLISPEKVKFLSAESETSIKDFWELFEAINIYLPKRDEVFGWWNAIRSWNAIYQEKPGDSLDKVQVWNSVRLAKYFDNTFYKNGKRGKIEDLQKLLPDDVSAIKWLDELHDFYNKYDLRDKVREYRIVADQSGFLDKLSALCRDTGINKELKDIAEKLEWQIRKELRDTNLTSLTQEDGAGDMKPNEVVDTLSDKLRTRADENPDDDFKDASTRLFAWIVNQEDWDRFKGFPMFTDNNKTNSSPVLHLPVDSTSNRPLAPIPAWAEDLRPFSNIFPPERILSDAFFKILPNPNTWKMLDDEKKLIRWNMIIHRDEMDLKILSPDPNVYSDNENDHKAKQPILVTDIAELDKIIKVVVYDSRTRGYLFWQFLTQWLVKQDTQGLECKEAICKCGETHKYHSAAWLKLVRQECWIRDGNPRHLPEAEHLAKLLRDNKWGLSSLNDNPDFDKLLQAMNVDTSALKRLFLEDEVIDFATELSGDDFNQKKQVLQDLEDDPTLYQDLDERRKRRHTVAENKRLGETVENLVKKNLEQVGFMVEKTGIGSDFEIWEDTEDIITLNITQQEQNKSWLVEVKSTRHQNVHISSKQAETAVQEQERFLLCVVPLGQENPTSDAVKDKMKFIKNISESIDPLWEGFSALMKGLRNINADVYADVILEVEEGKAGIRVNNSVWENDGIPLENLAEYLKQC